MRRQKTIGVSLKEYLMLRSIKEKVEKRLGVHFDWGAFLSGATRGDGLIALIIQDIIKEENVPEK